MWFLEMFLFITQHLYGNVFVTKFHKSKVVERLLKICGTAVVNSIITVLLLKNKVWKKKSYKICVSIEIAKTHFGVIICGANSAFSLVEVHTF